MRLLPFGLGGNMPNPKLVKLLVCLILLGTRAELRAQYFDIGSLVWASDVSNDGAVAGYAIGGAFYAFNFSQGLVNIGGSHDGSSASISTDGNFIGGSAANPANGGLVEAGRYDRSIGTWSFLGSLGSSSGGSASSHWGSNSSGSISVGHGWVDSGTAHAVQFSAGTVTDLGSTVPGLTSRANAVNDDGSVVVGWQDQASGIRAAAMWIDGIQSILDDGSGGVLAEAGAVTPDGQWIAGSAGNGSLEAWRYNVETETLDRLGLLAPLGGFLSATGITDDGRTIVGFERPPPGIPSLGTGAIWLEGQGIFNLTDYVAGLGIALPSGVVLTTPLAISGNGRHIVGHASNGRGFLVTIPEPASISLVFLSLSTVLMRWRNQRKPDA